MANLLLAERGSNPVQTVGEKWVYNFIDRHTELNTAWSRHYDYRRAKCEDPGAIKAWFDQVQITIMQHGIVPEDIYNFDETGYAMGLTATAKVVTRAEIYGKRQVIQPGNREWVTSIECINSTGWVLPPCRVRQIYRLGCDFHIQVHDLRMLDIASRSKSNCGYLLDI